MPRSSHGLDHLIVLCRDLASAAVDYEKLGFQVAPLMFHPTGTGNRLIMFKNDFLELMGVVDPSKLTERSSWYSNFLTNNEGYAAAIFLSADYQADETLIREHGFEMEPTNYFERAVTLSSGEVTGVKVNTVQAKSYRSNRHLMFLCRQHVPEALWIKEWQTHPNGAEEIVDVTIVAEDPQAFYAQVRFLWDAPLVDTQDEIRVRTADGGDMIVLSPTRAREAFPDLPDDFAQNGPLQVESTIRVASLKRLTEILDRNNVLYSGDLKTQIDVDPKHSAGARLAFVE